MTNRFIDLAHMLVRLYPRIQIRNKSESRFWRWMPQRFRDMGHCLPRLTRRGLVPVIWLPDHLDKDLFALLAHEGQHAIEMLDGPLVYVLLYALWPRFRADAELRAYMISMYAHPWSESVDRAERYVWYLCSGVYLWPCKDDYALEQLLGFRLIVDKGLDASEFGIVMPMDMMRIVEECRTEASHA